MRRPIWLLPVLVGLAGIAGCAGGEPTTITSTTPAKSASASATPPPKQSPATTGNGVDRLKPLEILQKAKQATTTAESVRIRGRVTDSGDAYELDIMAAGRQAAGYIKFDGQRMDMILNGKQFYIKGDKAFWTSTADKDAADMFAGKYLKTTIDDKDFADLAALASLPKYFEELPEPGDFTYARKGEVTKVGGVSAIPVGDLSGAKIYVATEGVPYVVRLDTGNEKDYLEFLDYGKTPDVKPPAGEVIDLDELTNESS